MKESEALLRVQEIDLALMRNRRTLSHMPQAKKLQDVLAKRKALSANISKIVGIRKDADMDLEDNEKGTARLKEIVAEVQEKYASGEASYRELADLESQLVSLAKRIEKYEFKHGELAERANKAHAAERNARALYDQLNADIEGLVASLKSDSADIEEEMKNLAAERAEVVESLSPQTMERYEAARKRFGGLAVESIRGNQPSICRVTIPASSFGDIRRGGAITECPYCHRLLVTDGMYDINN